MAQLQDDRCGHEHTCDLYGDTNHGLLNDLAKQQPKLEIPLRNSVPTHRSLLNRPFRAIIKGAPSGHGELWGIMYCSNTMWAKNEHEVYATRCYGAKELHIQSQQLALVLARFVTLNGSLANMMGWVTMINTNRGLEFATKVSRK